MARPKTTPPKSPPLIRTFALNQEINTLLEQLSRAASDFLGRSISDSAIIRALIRQVEKQGPSAADALFLEIERELKAGVLWGSKKRVSY